MTAPDATRTDAPRVSDERLFKFAIIGYAWRSGFNTLTDLGENIEDIIDDLLDARATIAALTARLAEVERERNDSDNERARFSEEINCLDNKVDAADARADAAEAQLAVIASHRDAMVERYDIEGREAGEVRVALDAAEAENTRLLDVKTDEGSAR